MDRFIGARSRRRSTAVFIAAVVALAALVGACTVPPEPTPTGPVAGLEASAELGNGAVTIRWNPPPATNATYEVQVRPAGGSWETVALTTGSELGVLEVVNRTRYEARVRSAETPAHPAGPWSTVASVLYVDLVLPVVRIDTGGAPILDKVTYVPGTFTIDPNGTAVEPYSGTMGIRGRGNSTWTYEKKPYRVKLDSKSPIMGLAAERDWVLLANAIEKSQLRTVLAMEASAATDLPYTPTLRHVEVVLNGHYEGVYLLGEHNEVGPDRIDITEMGPEDNFGTAVTGGYRLEIDFRLESNDEPGFRTGAGVPVVVKDPDPMTTAQRDYIRGRVQDFEDALLGPEFTDPEHGYRRYLDVDSFTDHYLVQELTRNQDVFHSSSFFTKERGDELFRFGPVWDFDRSIGTDGGVPRPAEGWWARTIGPWAPRLFQDPALVAHVAHRWTQLEPSFRSIVDSIPARAAAIAPAIDNDRARWSYTLEVKDRPEFLVDWLTTRMDWMSANLPTAPS